MGFTPTQVNAMSLWEFSACIDGYRKSQGAEDKPEAPTEAEFEDMVARLA